MKVSDKSRDGRRHNLMAGGSNLGGGASDLMVGKDEKTIWTSNDVQ